MRDNIEGEIVVMTGIVEVVAGVTTRGIGMEVETITQVMVVVTIRGIVAFLRDNISGAVLATEM